MSQRVLQFIPVLTLLLLLPTRSYAQDTASTGPVAELRATIRRYDDALRRGDATAVGEFWAPDYTFVNPRGERLSRADRLANVGAARTAFDSLAHQPEEEKIRIYGDRDRVAVYSALLTIGGRYSGRAERGRFRALVVWVRRNGRWQQLASQLTPVLGRE